MQYYSYSIYAQAHVQDIQVNLANLCIPTWKGTVQVT